MPEHPVNLPDPSEAKEILDFFQASGFTEQGLFDTLGLVIEPALPHLRNRTRLLDLTSEASANNFLLRWFLIGDDVSLESAKELIPKNILGHLLATGLLTEQGGRLSGAHLLLPCCDLYLASDHQARLDPVSGAAHVIHVNPASRFVLNAMVPIKTTSTLDVGTGGGILALHAAKLSDEVVATDINPRAIDFARFNARLNGVDNISFAVGDGFSAAEGRQFERIVCNPPFILSPGKEFVYRDSGMKLDLFCRQLAREAPEYLIEGGYFQMICEWVQRDDEEWHEAIAPWFAELPCDVWVFKEYSEDPSGYALMRLRETLFVSEEEDEAQYREWMEYYRRNRVNRIHGGLITMRRRDGDNWIRLDALPAPIRDPFGADIVTGFAGNDFLEREDSDNALLDAAPALSPDARLQQRYQAVEGAWEPVALSVVAESGLQRTINLDGPVAQFVARLDGQQRLSELVEQLAGETETDPERVQTDCLAVIRVLVRHNLVHL